MHNIRYIRNNPEQFEKLMKRRGILINSSEILDSSLPSNIIADMMLLSH